jgi:hypothetical protein
LWLAAPLGIYIVVRGLGLLILWWLTGATNSTFDLHQWDGLWYVQIAQHGYYGVDPSMADAYGHRMADTPMVFFPGYPLAVRVLAPVFAHNYIAAAVAVSSLAGVAGSYGIARLASRITGSRPATLLSLVLFAAAPMSIVYSMAYPEALLVALVAWTLVGLLARNWVLTGVCVAAAGYVSPMAAPLIGVVIVAAFIDIAKGRARWLGLAAMTFAPVGMIGYLSWVAAETGLGNGYFQVQRTGWGSGFDGGLATVRWMVHTWTVDPSAFAVLTSWFVVAVVVLLVLALRRIPWQAWLFCCAAVLLAVGSSGLLWDKVRLLLVVFPLLFPLATALARRRPLALGLITAVAVFGGLWFGAYALTVWHTSI